MKQSRMLVVALLLVLLYALALLLLWLLLAARAQKPLGEFTIGTAAGEIKAGAHDDGLGLWRRLQDVELTVTGEAGGARTAIKKIVTLEPETRGPRMEGVGRIVILAFHADNSL